MDDLDWQRHYAKLALRLNRHLGDGALVYHGPTSWQEDVRAEEPRSPAALVDDAEALLDACDGSPFRRAHVEAMRAVARFLTDERFPFPELARAVIGMEPRWVPEARFEQAHAWLADALPATSGTLAERMRAWQEASTLRTPERIPTLVDAAVAECRARTRRLVDLPPDDEVACVVVPQAHFHLAGLYQGGSRSTVYVNGGVPFSVADLLYNVAHEAHPGHIAETRLKVSAATTVDARVRFLYAPSLALGEGLGLAAEEIVFPDDEAQDWLAAHVFPEFAPELLAGRRLRPGALAAIHRAKNVLWGVWGNAALMAAEGRPDDEIAAYLARWALYDDAELAVVVPAMKPSPMSAYYLGYFHAWELVRPLVRDRDAAQRLLTEHLLPSDLAS